MEIIEERLREAVCLGDLETVERLTKEDININSRQKSSGWTALHWACKKGQEDIIRLLLSRGADPTIVNNKNETPADICSSPSMFNSFLNGQSPSNNHLYDYKIRTNILKNPSQSDPSLPRIKHSDISYMPSTMLPSVVPDEVSTCRRCYTVTSRKYSTPVNMKKTVLISKSKDIFTNLAFEDWMYKNQDFKTHHVLLMWQSDPCVVIGRHQNPFVEANLAELKSITECGVTLARRNSGGGTVFHDNGNLNLSFLTTHECYNRKYNLEIISRAITRECGLNVEINKREDLVIGDCKVSGTASKLGRPNAYHHCTLLVNANKENLSESLKKMHMDIKTNATLSVPSKIMNLSEKNQDISMEQLIKMIGLEYLQTPAFQGKNKTPQCNIPLGFKYVDPTEEEFPGFDQIRELFSGWKWIYGKTPKFVVKFNLSLPNIEEEFTVSLTIENGIICEVNFVFPKVFDGLDLNTNVENTLKNSIFSMETFVILKEIANDSLKDKVPLVV